VALTTNPSSNAEVKERVELKLSSPSGPSVPVAGELSVQLDYIIRTAFMFI